MQFKARAGAETDRKREKEKERYLRVLVPCEPPFLKNDIALLTLHLQEADLHVARLREHQKHTLQALPNLGRIFWISSKMIAEMEKRMHAYAEKALAALLHTAVDRLQPLLLLLRALSLFQEIKYFLEKEFLLIPQ